MKKKTITEGKSGAEDSRKRRVTRYSDKELEEFRSLVLQKLEEAKFDYEMLRSAVAGENSNGTSDTAPHVRLVEDLTDVFSKEEMSQLAVRRQKYIEQLKNALVRIENKTYGVCRVTGELIPPERLRSVPHTTLSMNAKRETAGL